MTAWGAEPTEARGSVPGAGETASFRFVLSVPTGTPPGRIVATADIDLGDQPRGELAETLLEVLPS